MSTSTEQFPGTEVTALEVVVVVVVVVALVVVVVGVVDGTVTLEVTVVATLGDPVEGVVRLGCVPRLESDSVRGCVSWGTAS